MMISDDLNLHVYPVRMKMTAMKQISTSHIFSTDESELNQFLVDKTPSQIFFTDDDESKSIIVAECSTKVDKS